MTVDVGKLKGAMTERGITQAELAAKLKIDPSTLNRKLHSSGLSFTVGQMHTIVATLELTNEEAVLIFLS